MKTISLHDLAAVAGGKGGVCVQNDAAWFPKKPIPDGGQGFRTKAACTAAVWKWDHSIMNPDSNVAD
jgi:hypothetical protein